MLTTSYFCYLWHFALHPWAFHLAVFHLYLWSWWFVSGQWRQDIHVSNWWSMYLLPTIIFLSMHLRQYWFCSFNAVLKEHSLLYWVEYYSFLDFITRGSPTMHTRATKVSHLPIYLQSRDVWWLESMYIYPSALVCCLNLLFCFFFFLFFCYLLLVSMCL